MITGVKAYSVDRYVEKLLINPTDMNPSFKSLYGKCYIKPKPVKVPEETADDFKKRISKEYTITVGNFTLAYDGKFRKRQYNSSFKILYRTEFKQVFFGHLSWNHKKQNHDINLLCLDISNYLFYQDDIDIVAIRLDLLKTFKLQHNNYSQFEICLDINYDIIRNFERRYMNERKYYFKSMNKIDRETLKILGYKRSTLIGEQFLFKSPSYNEQFKFYNKSLELNSNDQKSYIKDYFVQKNLDISKPIYRIEISMSRKSFARDFVNIDEEHFNQNYRLKRILNDYIRMYLDFRIIDHNSNKSRYRRDSFV